MLHSGQHLLNWPCRDSGGDQSEGEEGKAVNGSTRRFLGPKIGKEAHPQRLEPVIPACFSQMAHGALLVAAHRAEMEGRLFGLHLATLRRGAHFVAGGCQPPGSIAGATVSGPYRAKVIGNSLRELDRFLNLLANEVGRGMARSRDELWAIEREHNTANKIRSLHAHRGLVSPDHDRLRALGRSRDCMFHCDGMVKRGDDPGGAYLTLGWTDGGAGGDDLPGEARLLRVEVGERIEVSGLSLADVGRFYLGAAEGLVALRG